MAKKRAPAKFQDIRSPTIDRLKQETGTVIKDHDGKLSVALIYPNSYQVGMSNLGFQKVYHLFNRRPDVVCERAFLPDDKELALLKTKGQEPLSMETGRPLASFDIIAFSITFEHDYINVLTMLDLMRIKFRDRPGSDPLIIAGGICVTLNPEVMAPLFDLALIGEGEEIIDPLVDAVAQHGTKAYPAFAGLPGVYVTGAYTTEYNDDNTIRQINPEPGYPDKVDRVWDRNYAREPNYTRLQTPDTVFGDMELVEIGKGCGKHCRFCAAGYVYRPTRYAPYDKLIEAVTRAVESRGKVGLVGSAIADHPDIERILEHIVGMGGQFSLSSLRLDKLTIDFLRLLKKGGLKTITVAPEAGTEKLSRKINKTISDKQILDAVERIAKAGQFDMKLYFLVGLPDEEDADVDGIIDLVKSIQQTMVNASREKGKLGNISVGVNGFVPKPCSPYQWAPFEGIKTVRAKLKRIKSNLAPVANVTVSISSARYDYVQTLLSVGDRRAAHYIERAYHLDGDWAKALKDSETRRLAGADPDFFVLRGKAQDEVLPWSMVDDKLRDDYLWRENEKHQQDKITPECPEPEEECARCGQFEGVCVKM